MFRLAWLPPHPWLGTPHFGGKPHLLCCRSQVASIGDPEAEQELQDDAALQTSQLSWLLPSHVADNPVVLLGVAAEVRDAESAHAPGAKTVRVC